MRNAYVIVVALLLSTAMAAAQGRSTAPSRNVAVAGAPLEALINGTAIDADLIPIPNAPVRLRNLESRDIEQRKMADATGDFSFTVRAGIPYIVEIADSTGRILAVGDVVIAQPGDVVGALVAIAAKVPSTAGLFTDSIGSVISSAAGMGVTAVENTVLPFVSPER
jgi:hypothetical protein